MSDTPADLVARYAVTIDECPIDEVLTLFEADGRIEISGEGIHNTAEGTESIAELFRRSRATRAPTGTRLRHHVTTRWVEWAEDARRARGVSYFFVIGSIGVDHWGTYRDRFVRREGGWRFAERIVEVEGAASSGWWAGRSRSPQGR